MSAVPGVGFSRTVFLRGEQRYRCKDWSYKILGKPKPDRPLVKKALAVLLYNLGLSFRAAGKLGGVGGTTVLNLVDDYYWVDNFAEEHATKPAPAAGGVLVVVERNEMHHYL